MRGISKVCALGIALIFSIVAAAGTANAFVGQTTRVSVATTTHEAANAAAGQGAISADGRYVVFSSAATNLAAIFAGTTNVFRHDRTTGETVQVNVKPSGLASSGTAFSPTISAEGRYVVFASVASDLVDGDANAMMDVFWRDMAPGGVTKLVSVTAAGVQGEMGSGFSGFSGAKAISDDGRYVVFNSASTTLVPDRPNNGKQQIYRKDMTTGELVRVSVDATGAAGDNNSSFAVISGNGQVVAFRSESMNFSDLTVSASSQIFTRNLGAATPTTHA